MLGLDAGDLVFIQANLAALPQLRRLFETGNLYSLKTTSKLLTGSVWPTFYTGTLPGEHGIYHHLQWDPGSMRIRRVAEDWLYSEPFWYELARRGLKVTVADVPMVFPSRLKYGTEIVNWGSHDQLGPFHCNRSDLQKLIGEQWGAHPMGPEIPVNKNRRQLDRILQNLIIGAQKKGQLIESLLQTTPWDFFLAVFGESHRGGHILWPEDDSKSMLPDRALLQVYQAIDRAIGGILNRIDLASTNLILFSLHGMQINQSQEHFVAPVMAAINTAFFQQKSRNIPHSAKQKSLMRWLRQHVPTRLQHAIAQAVPVAIRDWVVSRATTGGYDWQRTPALPLLADYNGYLRFNVKGREKQGSIELNTPLYEQYSDFVAHCFRGLTHQVNGQPLVENIVDAQSIFPGVHSQLLPDRIITWRNSRPATRIVSPLLGSFTARLDTGRSGNHRHEGFALFSGAEGQEPINPNRLEHIADLAPLLLRRYRHRSVQAPD